jgi:cation transport regulator ChaC
MYLATEDNPNYVGPAPLSEIAARVRRCVGPSGSNVEYVLRLAEALRALGVPPEEDEHVFELAARVAEP